MKKTTKAVITSAAMAGLIAGAAQQARAMGSSAAQQGAKSYFGKSVGSGMQTLEKNECAGKGGCGGSAGGKHDCKGKNDCKGQGGCATSENTCKGKNECKGKGGCNTNTPPKGEEAPKAEETPKASEGQL